jgi:predicted AlkP superfamily pyrophosphatase or phosphodiesterase
MIKLRMIFVLYAASLLSGVPTLAAAGPTATVMLISIDGLKPEAVLEAQQHGLKLPNLVQLTKDGVYSIGVRGVLPTLTHPSHATLVTGVSPAKHGIYANTTFDPLNRNERGAYWYSEDIKVPALWDAAHAAGLRTANVYWPVTVGAHIDENLPPIWRTGQPDDLKLQRALGTPGLEVELVKQLGRYPGGLEETIDADEVRAKFAIRLLERTHPALMTVFLAGLDTEEHTYGPFSDKANAGLERLDAVVGELRKAAEKNAPGHAYVCVVSDHGFAAVQHDVNLYEAFLSAGLFTLDADHKIADWKAMPWPAGGSAAIMLKDPSDQVTKAKVADLLTKLAADPGNGIDKVLDHDALVARGGFPDAAFFISLKIGYELGYQFAPPLVSKPSKPGMHGYSPENDAMRSSFFLVGPGVASGKSLGEIDMRSIAPTLAKLLNAKLPDAELPPLF